MSGDYYKNKHQAIIDIMFINTKLNDIVNVRTIDVGSDLRRQPVTICTVVMLNAST